jgi:hypothetical protein
MCATACGGLSNAHNTSTHVNASNVHIYMYIYSVPGSFAAVHVRRGDYSERLTSIKPFAHKLREAGLPLGSLLYVASEPTSKRSFFAPLCQLYNCIFSSDLVTDPGNYVHVYVCMYIYMYCVYVYVYVYMCMCICVYVYVYMCMCICVCVYVYVYMCMCICVCVYVYVYK